VIDGWGIPTEESPKDGDAIAAAKTPVMDELSASATGFTELEASSLAVGLPEGLMGNSEVGHLNIGAGRVVWQDVVRIDQAVKTGEFRKNDVISKTIQAAKDGTGRLHLCGLVSHGGVVSTPWMPAGDTKANPVVALQANAPLRPGRGRRGCGRPRGLHPLLRRWARYRPQVWRRVHGGAC